MCLIMLSGLMLSRFGETGSLHSQEMEDPFQGGIPPQDRLLHPDGLVAASGTVSADDGLASLDTAGVLTRLSLAEPRLLRSPTPGTHHDAGIKKTTTLSSSTYTLELPSSPAPSPLKKTKFKAAGSEEVALSLEATY